MITFDVATYNHPPPPVPLTQQNYAKVDLNSFQSYLLDVDLDHSLSVSYTNLTWSQIKNSSLSACNLYIPVENYIHFPCRWFNAELRLHLSKTHTPCHRLLHYPTDHVAEYQATII